MINKILLSVLALTVLKTSFAQTSFVQNLQIPIVFNLQQDGIIQNQSKKVILLYVSAPLCAFCKNLEKDVLVPLIHSGEYEDKIILRKINWRAIEEVVDFDGIKKSPAEILKRYDIKITPTLLFLNSKGEQINQRLLGYRGGEFYWYYLDVAIDKANRYLKRQ